MIDFFKNIVPVTGKYLKRVKSEVENIKSPDFLRPIAGKYLLKRETEKPMTFRVGEGMTPEQTKLAYKKISEQKAPGIYTKVPFTQKEFVMPEDRISLMTKDIVEIPERIHTTLTKELPFAIKHPGEVPEPSKPYYVKGYAQIAKENVNNLINAGFSPKTAAWATVLGVGGGAINDVVILSELVGSGTKMLARGLIPKTEEKIAAWKLLGQPKTLSEAKQSYRALAKQLHPDIVGEASTGAMSDLNNAYRIIKKSGVPTKLDFAKLQTGRLAGRLNVPISKITKKPSVSRLPLKALPGYAEEPTPAMGLSIKPRKPVGFGKKEAKALVPKELEKEAKILRGTKGMTAEDIMKKYPNIKLKKDVPAKDVYGNKVEIPKGEKLTPYELKGNKILLQDGNTYLVSKNQFQNIKGQSKVAEAKEFAPELKGTEESIKGEELWQGNSLIDNGKEIATLQKNDDGTWSFISDFSEGTEKFKTKDEAKKQAEMATIGNVYGKHGTKYSQYTLPGGKNYKEILIRAPMEKDELLKKKGWKFIPQADGSLVAIEPNGVTHFNWEKRGYNSSHWDEPNVLSHIRLNERTYKGKPVTFLEEIQSDWAKDLRTGKTKISNPLLKNWQEWTIKRALQEAVKNKSKYFSWINGEQTSERYNLATYLDNVEWDRTYKNNLLTEPKSWKIIDLNSKQGRDIGSIIIDEKGIIREAKQADWKGKKLDEVLGKGLAEKIMSKPKGTLSGEGLKFGGEWASNLYDKQVPNIVKKLTGAKIIKMDMGLPIKSSEATGFWLENPNGVEGLKLTPKDLRVGREIRKGIGEKYIITDVLGDGKFKAIPKVLFDELNTIRLRKTGKSRTIKEMAEYVKNRPEVKTFDISQPKTTQQGIKLTPEVVARIKGKAPKIKTSGVMFEAKSKLPEKTKAVIPYEGLKLPTGEPVLGGKRTIRATAIKRLREELKQYRGEKTITQIKQELVDYVRKNLPLSIRGKMLVQVKNVRTKEGLEKAINLADKYNEMLTRKELREQIIKEVKSTRARVKDGILRGKYTADVQRKLNRISLNMFIDRNLAREKIAENIRLYHEGKLGYDEMVKQNELLNISGIRGMTSQELQNVLKNIKSLKETGKTIRELKEFNEQTRIERMKDKFKDIITGGRGIKKGALSLPRKALEYGEGRGVKGKLLKAWIKIRNWQFGWDNILDELSKFDKTSKPYQSALSKFGENVHISRDLQNAGEKKYLTEVQNKAKEIFGVKGRRELNAILSRLKNEKVNLGTFRNLDGEPIKLELTKGQIMQKYLEMQDPTLTDTFRDGMRWTDKIMEAIKKSLTPKEKRWADWHKEFYQMYYNTINPVYRYFYGIDLPRNPNYVPIGRDIEANIPEDVLVARELSRYSSVVSGSLKRRVKTKTPLRFNDLDDVLVNHIIQMEHFKNWAKTMRDLRRVFGDKEIRTAIRQYHGADTLKTIDGYLNDMARDGIDRVKIVKGVDILRRNFTKAVLGIKPAVALKQIGSVLAYTTEMPISDFIGGVTDFWKHPIENYRFLLEKSPYLQKRFSAGFERDIRFAMKKSWSKQLSSTGNISDWLMALIRTGDKFAVIQGSWAKYKSALKNGKSTIEAIQEAEQATRRTQPTSDLETLSSLQRGGSWMKLFTMFQNQPNKYFRIMADNARNFIFGRGSRLKAIYNFILSWVVLPSIFQFMADAFHFRKEHQLRILFLGPLNDFLVINQMAQSIYGWLTNEPFDYQASPVFSTAKDLQYAITKTKKIVNPAKNVTTDDFIKAVEYYGKAIGQLTGVPTPYLIQAERALRRGAPEELIFSPYSLGKTEKKKVGKSGVNWDKVFGGKTTSPSGVNWSKVFSK